MWKLIELPRALDPDRQGNSFWTIVGWMGAATVIIMISYYITIVSDVMFYIFKYLAGVTPLGMDLFTFMDFVAMLITLPIGAIFMSIYVGTKFWDRYMEHSAVGAKYFKVPRFLKPWYIIGLPVITALVVVVGIAGYF